MVLSDVVILGITGVLGAYCYAVLQVVKESRCEDVSIFWDCFKCHRAVQLEHLEQPQNNIMELDRRGNATSL